MTRRGGDQSERQEQGGSASAVAGYKPGFLARLRRSQKGNVLPMMAMAIIPLAGVVGGSVDMSRMYLAKSRLQQACDAGALAGRKVMGGGSWDANGDGNLTNDPPRTAALEFFDQNYPDGAWGTTGRTRAFSESAGRVSGTASVTVPMMIMRLFGFTSQTIEVACDAEMRLPNTDIMFVLDVTGSMGDTPSGDTQSKISGLRVAVKCFYEIVARLNTDATCTTGVPSGGTGSQVQLRFGFMPYAVNVNVGKSLPKSYFADSWPYQSREPEWTTSTGTVWVQQGTPVVTTSPLVVNNAPQNLCNNASAEAYGYNSNTDVLSNNGNTKTNTRVLTNVDSWSNNTCYATQTRTVTTYNKTTGTTYTFNRWRYASVNHNVSALKNGTVSASNPYGWADSLTLKLGNSGTDKTITWEGCIEERQTVQATSYSPIPANAHDLNIDKVPDATTGTRWGFLLEDVTYQRKDNDDNRTTSAVYKTSGTHSFSHGGYSCPTEARKLQTWPDAGDFEDYVDSLVPEANTYHDIGLLWGARFASPTGIFASENAETPQGGEIERHIIFMTDGDTNTSNSDYNAYGVPWYDRRQTTSTSNSDLDTQVDVRFEALCTAVKNKNITLWVISFGPVSSSTTTRLTNCATAGRYFSAADSAALQTTFKSIADQISQLRLTK